MEIGWCAFATRAFICLFKQPVLIELNLRPNQIINFTAFTAFQKDWQKARVAKPAIKRVPVIISCNEQRSWKLTWGKFLRPLSFPYYLFPYYNFTTSSTRFTPHDPQTHL
jgi:hypothetical protein